MSDKANNSAAVQLVKLNNPDESFRAIAMLMAADKNYQKLPMAAAPKVFSVIARQHYQLMVVSNQVVGCVLWGEISNRTLDSCLADKREPTQAELLNNHGDAIIALALVAKQPGLVRLLWRSFVRLNHARPILAIRHFGKYTQNPKYIVYRNGRVSDLKGRKKY